MKYNTEGSPCRWLLDYELWVILWSESCSKELNICISCKKKIVEMFWNVKQIHGKYVFTRTWSQRVTWPLHMTPVVKETSGPMAVEILYCGQ